MAELYPEKGSSKYAEEGTLAHKCAEDTLTEVLMNEVDFEDALTMACKNGVDDEMREHVRNYCQAVFSLLLKLPDKIALERKFLFASDSEHPELGGSADVCFKYQGTGVIIDLKYGAGHAVEVEDNAQLATYICAMNADPEWGQLERGVVYIYQPRVEHPDGPLRSWSLSKKDIAFWTEVLVAGVAHVERSIFSAQVEYHPGDHCRWCPGEAVCEANRKHLIGDAALDFIEPATPPAVDTLTQQQIALLIKNRSLIESYLKRVDEFALEQMKAGAKFDELKLVHGRTARTWRPEITGYELECVGVSEPYAPRKLKGIGEVEKEIGKGKIGKLTIVPEPALKVAHVSDKRPAVSESPAEIDFEF
jgi:hypothetical protein